MPTEILISQSDLKQKPKLAPDAVNLKPESSRGLSLKAAFFLLGLLVMLVGAEFAARQVFSGDQIKDRPSSFQQWIRSHDVQHVEIISFGNSHAVRGIDPAFFSKNALNLAHSGQDLYYDYKLWEKVSPHLSQARYLVICLDYFSFGHDLAKTQRYLVKSYEKFGIPPRNWNLWAWLESHSYLLMYRTMLFKIMVGKLKKQSPEASKPKDALKFNEFPENVRSSIGGNRAQAHMAASYFKKDEGAFFQYLKSLIDSALRRNLKVLIFTPPTNPEYHDKLTPDFVANFKSLLGRLMTIYENNAAVAYEDYTRHPLFQAGDYYDADHVNVRGAEKLTKLLDAKLRELWNETQTQAGASG